MEQEATERETFPSDPFDSMPPEPPEGYLEVQYPPIETPADDDAVLTAPLPSVSLEDEAKKGMSGVYAHRETGTLIRILSMDSSYVRYAMLDGSGRHALPRSEYEASFGKWWRPATAEDLQGAFTVEGDAAPPKDVPDDWAR